MTDRQSYDPFAPPPPAQQADTSAPPPPAVAPAETPVVESVSDYAAELPDDLDDITKADLVALAELAGVATYGTKAEIAQRIREA